jgi:hypothetical protein
LSTRISLHAPGERDGAGRGGMGGPRPPCLHKERRRAVEGRLGEIQDVRSERKAGGIRFAIVANKFKNAD